MDITKKYTNIYNVLLELLEDRQYIINEDTPDDIKIDSFDFECIHSITNEKIKIFYNTDLKIGINHIKQYIQILNTENIHKTLIIYSGNITTFAKQHIKSEKSCVLDFFHETELYKNITKHYLVPKHEVINQSQKKELLAYYNIQTKNLPKILITDPISRYFGCKVGDIFKILRFDNNMKTVSYRVVVP